MLLHGLTFIVAIGLFYTRKTPEFWQAMPVEAMHKWGTHISNFSIMILLLCPAGFVNAMYGSSTKGFWVLLCLFTAINIIYDLWIPILNTPDLTDSIFGLAGAFVSGSLFMHAVKTRRPAAQDS